MTSTIEELAERIAALDPAQQEALLHMVAELNLQRGLKELSNRYRERLAQEGKLDQKADEVLAGLKQSRKKIAADDYRL